MRGILRFIFFICKHKKLLPFLRLLVGVWVCYCLILGFCFLQNCQYAKIVNYYSDILEVSTRSCICCRHTACETPTFFCARKNFTGKTFLTFYFETCSNTGIIFRPLASGLMRGVLRFIFFICRHEKLLLFLTAFGWSLGLLLPDSTILLPAKLPVCQNSELLLRHSGGEHKVMYLLLALPMWNSYIFLC